MRLARRHPFTSALAAALLTGAAAAPAAGQPAVLESFRAQIALKSAGGPRISPDGRLIAYSVTTTDWEANRFDREIWLAPPGRRALPAHADRSREQHRAPLVSGRVPPRLPHGPR